MSLLSALHLTLSSPRLSLCHDDDDGCDVSSASWNDLGSHHFYSACVCVLCARLDCWSDEVMPPSLSPSPSPFLPDGCACCTTCKVNGNGADHTRLGNGTLSWSEREIC